MKETSKTKTIVIHKGLRTGGTAIVAAFSELAPYHVLMDPIHPNLSLFPEIRLQTSSDWRSRHPPGFRYWRGYDKLTSNGTVPGWKNRFASTRALPPSGTDPELSAYLSGLERAIRDLGLIPVFAFEEGEALWDLIQDALGQPKTLTVNREPDSKFASWIDQLQHGNTVFFQRALEIAKGLGWQPSQTWGRGELAQMSVSDLRVLFDAYEIRVRHVHSSRSDAEFHFPLDSPRRLMDAQHALNRVGLSHDSAVQVTTWLFANRPSEP